MCLIEKKGINSLFFFYVGLYFFCFGFKYRIALQLEFFSELIIFGDWIWYEVLSLTVKRT